MIRLFVVAVHLRWPAPVRASRGSRARHARGLSTCTAVSSGKRATPRLHRGREPPLDRKDEPVLVSQVWLNQTEFILVDAERNTSAPAFDHARLAAALSHAAKRDYSASDLPFSKSSSWMRQRPFASPSTARNGPAPSPPTNATRKRLNPSSQRRALAEQALGCLCQGAQPFFA